MTRIYTDTTKLTKDQNKKMHLFCQIPIRLAVSFTLPSILLTIMSLEAVWACWNLQI